MLGEPKESDKPSDLFVYRVVVPSDWHQAKESGQIPAVEVDRLDGYFHLSPRDQILVTAGLYFSPDQAPAVIEFEAAALGADLVWEPVPERDGRLFPHLYAETLPLSAARALIELKAMPDGTFSFGPRTAVGNTAVQAD